MLESMRNALAVLVMLTLAACSGGSSEEDRVAKRCAQVKGEEKATDAKLGTLVDELHAIADGRIEFRDAGTDGRQIIWAQWSSSRGDLDAFLATQNEARTQARLIARIVLNNEECYSAAEYATAQEFLGRTEK